jgi:GNAT superfamily N-acetyltransferase
VTASPEPLPPWRRCTVADAEVLARLNARLSRDEGAPIGSPAEYLVRMRSWLTDDSYQAAMAETEAGEPVAHVVWRSAPDDGGGVFVRQFSVVPSRRGRGLGARLFERAVQDLWPGEPLRLDVLDTNPRGRAFWERMGFASYSRVMHRAAEPPPQPTSAVR